MPDNPIYRFSTGEGTCATTTWSLSPSGAVDKLVEVFWELHCPPQKVLGSRKRLNKKLLRILNEINGARVRPTSRSSRRLSRRFAPHRPRLNSIVRWHDAPNTACTCSREKPTAIPALCVRSAGTAGGEPRLGDDDGNIQRRKPGTRMHEQAERGELVEHTMSAAGKRNLPFQCRVAEIQQASTA
jgi:hypothetical protein